MEEDSQKAGIDQSELDALLNSLKNDEAVSEAALSSQSESRLKGSETMPTNNTQEGSSSMEIDQAELDKLLAELGSEEGLAAPSEMAFKQTAAQSTSSTNIDQAELDALLASLGDDELFSDEPPQVNKPNSAASPPKQERPLSQEEIDALLASLGN